MNRSTIRIAPALVMGLLLAVTNLTSTAVAQAPPTDKEIAFWVVEALREDPRVQFSDILVACDQGAVNLTGSVFSLAESQYARLIALKIQGVRKVSNRLTVDTPQRRDLDIATDVQRRLLQSSSLVIHGLKVSSSAGKVVIRGIVSSLTNLEEATLLASEVRGVKEVENGIEVRFAIQRSDNEIAKDLEAALRRDVYLNTLPITISVNNGVVVLSGSVGNAYQQERATQEARRVANVIRIDNQLQVQWQRERGVRREMPRPSDAELQSLVHAELTQDLRLDAADISVSAEGGHVILRGTVGTFSEKQIATEAALSVAGTVWASNLLAVQLKSRDSGEIQRDIVAALQSDYLLQDQRIDVRVSNGAATLSGFVSSANEKVHAAELAGRVLGVRAVNNVLEVAWSPKYRDAGLEARVRTRLQASAEARWVANQIVVRVENSKVTLTGDVRTWAQRREAGRVAQLTDGVWAVDNRLTINNVQYQWEQWYSDTPTVYFDAYPEYQIKFLERRF